MWYYTKTNCRSDLLKPPPARQVTCPLWASILAVAALCMAVSQFSQKLFLRVILVSHAVDRCNLACISVTKSYFGLIYRSFEAPWAEESIALQLSSLRCSVQKLWAKMWRQCYFIEIVATILIDSVQYGLTRVSENITTAIKNARKYIFGGHRMRKRLIHA